MISTLFIVTVAIAAIAAICIMIGDIEDDVKSK